MEWVDCNRIYPIDFIVRAERAERGTGWYVYVKWSGYPLPTRETLSYMRTQTSDYATWEQIRQAQVKYDLEYPEKAARIEKNKEASKAPRPEPTRKQPARAARMMSLTGEIGVNDSTGDTGLEKAEERALCHGFHCLLAQQRAEHRWSPTEYHNDDKIMMFADWPVDVILIE